MTPGERKELLTRYLNGTCTPEEERQIAWLLRGKDLDSELLQLIDEMMSKQTNGAVLSRSDKDRIYQGVQQQVGEERKRRWNVPFFFIAASISLLLMGFAGWYIWNTAMAAPAVHQIASGERHQIITMPDGTKVWLNAHSSLKYADNYGREDRSVTLQGEAFFQVKPDKERPFMVTAGPIQTRVLGTSFNFRAEKGQDDISVTLLEGKVAINKIDTLTGTSTQELATLSPDHQVVYSRAADNAIIRPVAAADYIGWKDDILILKNISMKEAVSRIEKWYGVRIIIRDAAINQCIIHASFTKEPLTTVLHTLGMTSAFAYRQRGNEIILSGKGCR